jgi:TolA-binding protein
MDKRRTRHSSWLVLFLFLATVSAGCEMPQSGGVAGTATTSSSSDEAEHTRKIEEKAAEIERMAAEIQAMTGTEQQKIDAVNRLEEKRRELQELQDSQ